MSNQNDQIEKEEENELVQIERMSQSLETLYKEMEQKRRENLLFEAYILRNEKDKPKEEEDDKKKKKKQEDRNKRDWELTAEEKYEIAQAESQALKKNIDEGRIKSDSILQTLRAILEETDMAITEIRKDAFDFQREILIGGENSRTGKIEAQRIQKYFEEKLRQKDALIEQYRAQQTTLESQIWQTNNQILKQEEMGDDLKFIDFHQLQIENKKHVQEIDDKNQKLISLKVATGAISSVLIEEQNKLEKEIQRGVELVSSIAEKEQNIANIQQQIIEVRKNKDKAYDQKKTLDKQIEGANDETEDVPKPIVYVKQKNEQVQVLYEIKNLERKIEIADLQYQKAKVALNIKN